MPTGAQNLGSQLGSLLFGDKAGSDQAYFQGKALGAQVADRMESARKNRADAMIGEDTYSNRQAYDATPLIDPNATLEQRAEALRVGALANLGSNLSSGMDAYSKGRGQERIDAAEQAFRGGNTALGNMLLAASEGKPLETTSITDGTAFNKYAAPDQPMNITALGDAAIDLRHAQARASDASATNSYASAAKTRGEMGSSGTVVGGGKAADWSIQQGADGQLYRVNKLDGRAMPVVTQGAPAEGQPVVGANRFKADAQEQKMGKQRAALQAGDAELDRLASAAQEVLDSGGLGKITGVYGVLPNMPGGAAANTQAKLDALKSQVGFTVLQNMRNNSPTGGALGQVSDRENEMLQNNLAALSRAQSEDEYRAQLQKIIDFANGSKTRRQDAFNVTYGASGGAQQPPAASVPAAPAPGAFQVGQIIMHNGKPYRVTGGDPNDPDVEPVQ